MVVENVKKFILALFAELVILIGIFIWYLENVQTIYLREIAQEMDNLDYFALAILSTGIILLIILSLSNTIRTNPKWFSIPSLIIGLGIALFIILSITPCCPGG